MNRRHTDFQSAINPPPDHANPLSDIDLGNNPVEGANPGAARGAAQNTPDAQLAAIIQAWPTLPEAVRAGIVAMVTAARREG